MVSVLFVCLANICRSPAAEGVLKQMAKKMTPAVDVLVESCGIGSWSVGQMPDERMRFAAGERGVVLAGRARQFNTNFYDEFDYILAVDSEVYNLLIQHAGRADQKAKVHLITEYSTGFHGQPIPDPYYSGDGAFDHVLDMLEDSCQGLLNHIRERQC